MIRAFVALKIPGYVCAHLSAAQSGLPCGRIVPPENFHVTLAFLGEHPEPLIEDAHVLFEEIRAPELTLAISGIGTFGTMPPRAIYAAVQRTEALSHLRKKVARTAREAGITLSGEKFTPHVTLARFGSKITAEDALRLEQYIGEQSRLSVDPFPVTSFKLFRSTLGKHAPTYDVLADYPLGDAALSA